MDTAERDDLALSARDGCLLSLLLGESLTKERMAILTEGLNVDDEGENFLLMLSRVGFEQGWELFPPQIVPRLRGIHRHVQVNNATGVPWLLDKLRTLRAAGIPVMLLKGLALRCHYDPRVPRMMFDYDIAVPEDDFARAMALLEKEDERALDLSAPHHSKIVRGRQVLELHRWIFKHHGEQGSDIWERAVPIDFYGVRVCVPCPADMIVHLMDNRSRDLFSSVSQERRVNWLYDCHRIFEFAGEELDAPLLAERAAQLHVSFSVRRMLRFFASLFPELISPAEVEKAFPQSAAYDKWLRRGMVYRRARLAHRARRDAAQGPLSPARILRGLRLSRAFYRWQKTERPYRSFAAFFAETHGADGLGDYLRRRLRSMRAYYRSRGKGAP